MGYHIILRATVKVNPDYAFLLQNGHEFFEDDFEAETLPTPYRELIEIWQELEIGSCFYVWEFEEGILKFEIQKKPYKHNRMDLQSDYRLFMKRVIVPITTFIESCEIEHDDWGCEHYYYTDKDVREWGN
jgi:hypothetical protein